MEEGGGDVRDVCLLYLVLMCRRWRAVTQVRKFVQYLTTFGVRSTKHENQKSPLVFRRPEWGSATSTSPLAHIPEPTHNPSNAHQI